MVSFSSFTKKSIAILACSILVNAAPLDKKSESPGFVKLEFDVVPKNNSDLSSPSKRDTVSAPLTNNKNEYKISFIVGSDKQSFSVALDTGSSDLWIADSKFRQGGYSPALSKTAVNTHQPFSILYGSGNAFGTYYRDSVGTSGGPTLQSFEFADVTYTPISDIGLLGIGYQDGEAATQQYPNFPVALKNAGDISKVAYSIYLNELNATTGAIIFGGIDTAKAENLTTVPIVDPSRLSVNVTSLIASDGTVLQTSAGFKAVLDSGTTLVYLPDDIIQSLASTIPGATYNAQNQNIVLSSSTLPSDQYISYNFLNGITIRTPLSALVVQNFNSNGDGLPGYALAIAGTKAIIPGTTPVYILGDYFLRSAYVVFDLEDNTVQLGQAVYTSKSNIVPIN